MHFLLLPGAFLLRHLSLSTVRATGQIRLLPDPGHVVVRRRDVREVKSALVRIRAMRGAALHVEISVATTPIPRGPLRGRYVLSISLRSRRLRVRKVHACSATGSDVHHVEPRVDHRRCAMQFRRDYAFSTALRPRPISRVRIMAFRDGRIYSNLAFCCCDSNGPAQSGWHTAA